MIDNIENKIENLRLQECSLKNRSFWKLVILLETYETETVTSGLCYIEDLIFLENNIVWFWISLHVQSIDSLNYIIYFYIRGSFLKTFCTSFWKRLHNSKKIVNMQGLFVLTISRYMAKYPLTKYYYIIEKVYFIYTLLVLFISTLSFLLFLYTVLWR